MTHTNTILDEIRRLHDDREGGKLAVSKDDEHIDIFFREGMIEAVSSNLDRYRLGHYLIREGWLKTRDLDLSLAESRRNNMLFGEAAIWKKFLDPVELAEVVRLQVIDLLKYVVTNPFFVDNFTAGLHTFYVPAKINFPHFLLELFRSDPTPLEPDPTQLMVLSGPSDLSHMPWYPQELAVLSELRTPKTFQTLLASVRMPEDSLKKILGVFMSLGLLELSRSAGTENQNEHVESDKAVAPIVSFPYEEMIPQVMNAISSEKLETRQNVSSFISEQFRNLKVRISQAESDIPLQVIAVSSPESQEGKSLISSNMAFAFSMDPGRRVIVVDCDLRNPTLDKYLGVTIEPGLLGYLTKNHLGPHCFMRRLDNLFFMSTGGIASNPIELLSLGKMKELIAYLKTQFDTIILDAPPFSPIADARVVAALSDGMLLVVRRGKTTYSSLERAFKLVDRNKLLGVIFNDVKPMLFNTYYHYGYYHYGQDSRYPYTSHRKARSIPKNYLES